MDKRPINPFLTTLFAITALTLIAGLILTLAGYRISQSYDATNDDPTAGLAQLAIGTQLLSLGFVGLLLTLAAAAVIWHPAPPIAPDPKLVDSL
jgi:hypothetical protein